jgi:hypothetical protein
VQKDLMKWLHKLPPELQQTSRRRIEKTSTAVMRAKHFQTARNVVRSRLPIFVVLGTDPELVSLNSLLHLISERAKATGEKLADAGRTFLNKLNSQLTTLQFSGMTLHLESTPAGVLLQRDEQPVQAPVEAAEGARTLLERMQTKAALAIAYSRIACQTEPILLFAGPEQILPTALHSELADFIINISNTCQCLCSLSDIDIFPDDAGYRRYSTAEGSLLPMPMDEHK